MYPRTPPSQFQLRPVLQSLGVVCFVYIVVFYFADDILTDQLQAVIVPLVLIAYALFYYAKKLPGQGWNKTLLDINGYMIDPRTGERWTTSLSGHLRSIKLPSYLSIHAVPELPREIDPATYVPTNAQNVAHSATTPATAAIQRYDAPAAIQPVQSRSVQPMQVQMLQPVQTHHPQRQASNASQESKDAANIINNLLMSRYHQATEQQKIYFKFQICDINETPDYVVYPLICEPGAPTTQLEKMLKIFETEIFKARGGQGERITVKLTVQPLELSVTRSRRVALPWESRAKNTTPHFAQLGVSFNGATPRLIGFDMTDQKSWYMALFSSPGGGKSSMLRSAALSILEQTPPENCEFFFIDLDSNQFDSWTRIPHVKYVARTYEEAITLLRWYLSQVNGNRDLRNNVHRYLVIDELHMLTDDCDGDNPYAEAFQSILSQLCKRARKHRNSFIFSTQDPTGDNFPAGLQKTVKIAAAGYTVDDQYLSQHLKVQGASTLRGDGDFVINEHGHQVGFKGFYVADVEAVVNSVVAKWGADDSVYNFQTKRPTVPAATVEFDDEDEWTDDESLDEVYEEIEVDNSYAEEQDDDDGTIFVDGPKPEGVEADALKLMPYLGKALNAKGRLKTGWGIKLIKVITGEDLPNEGRQGIRMRDAVKYAQDNLMK